MWVFFITFTICDFCDQRRISLNRMSLNYISLFWSFCVAIYKFRARFRIILCMRFDMFSVGFVIFKFRFFSRSVWVWVWVWVCRCLCICSLCMDDVCASILFSLMPLFLLLKKKLNASTVILFLYNVFAYIFGIEPPDQIKILFICPFFQLYFAFQFIHKFWLNS